MANLVQNDKKCNEHSDNRGAYIAPKLKVFGPVGTLTQAGTGGVDETGGGNKTRMA